MNINRYIAFSLAAHLLFVILTGLIQQAYPPVEVFNVRLADPFRSETPQAVPEKSPPVQKTKPQVIKRGRKPPEKTLRPEKLYGEGTGKPARKPAAEENKNTEKKESTAAEHKRVTPRSAASSEKQTAAGPVTETLTETVKTDKPDETGGTGFSGPVYAAPDILFDKKTIEKYALKETPEQKGLTFDTSGFKNRGYMNMLKDRIESTWKYPEEARERGISGDLYIRFSILRDGKLDKVELVRTSGFRDLDEAAIRALKESGPFWPLPEDWTGEKLEITGQFIYIFGSAYVM